jgi:ribose-phosphate pyrophosphokinase
MKTLNLVYPEKSDIKFRIDKFPDGQRQVVIFDKEDQDGCKLNYTYIAGKSRVKAVSSVQIKSRLNNFQDLELIVCATKSLRGLGVKKIHLYTPYFLGSRSDRQFEEGSNNYLKDVICPIINGLNFESVTVLDPHSDVLEACLNNFNKKSNLKLVSWCIDSLYNGSHNENCILVSPDAGASKKIYKLAEQIGYNGDIITCSKDRDTDGKLTKTVVPVGFKNLENKDFIIIDDICDGGATFINIAKEIRKWPVAKNSKIHLIVTHGIFSRGIMELNQYFDKIYCTNSYSDLQKDKFGNNTKDFVKQLNVF